MQATTRPSPAGSIKAYSIPFKVPGSQVDRQLLHFYCSEAAERLAGFSDPTLWTQLILQRCHHQPVIRSALVALSSLYLDHMYGASDVAPIPFESRPKSMEIISKCHRQLASHLRSPGASTEVALICGLIFYTFECLVGDTKQATWHLDQGVKLLQRTLVENPGYFASPDGMSDCLISIFSRLDVQASIYDSERLPGLQLLSQESMVTGLGSIVPDEFASSAHAENVLTRLQNITMHHITIYLEYKRRTLDELPSYVRNERLAIMSLFQNFKYATTELLARIESGQNQPLSGPESTKHQNHNQKSRQHILLLETQAEMFHSVLVESSTPSSPKKDADNADDGDFDAVLTHISSVLDMAKAGSENPLSGSGFMLCTQLIATLYYMCMKAQTRQIRQRALSMLQDPRIPEREGLWNAKQAAFVVESMMFDHDRDIPEEIRAETKLEDFGAGIVDVGGVDTAFQLLKIGNQEEGLVES